MKVASLKRKVLATLNEERARLIAGDIEGLAPLIDEKLRLSERMSQLKTGFGEADIAEIRSKTLHNEKLFEAAMAGINTVRKRVTDIRDAEKDLKTYGANGELNTSNSAAKGVERRA